LQLKKCLYIALLFAGIFLFSEKVFSNNPKKHSLDPNKSLTQYIHKVWTTGNQFLQNSINTITQAEDGLLVIGTSNGLLKFDGINFSAVNLGLGENKSPIIVSVVLKAKDNSLWIGTNKGIVQLKNWQPVDFSRTKGFIIRDVISICEGNDGTIWIGTNNFGILKYSNKEFSVFEPDRLLFGSVIFCMSTDKQNNLWVGTNGAGLFKINNNKVTRFTTADGLSNNVIKSLLIDEDNNIWIGTNGTGLNLLKSGKITKYDKKDGLTNEVISDLLKDSRNTLWIGTEGGGLNRFVNGKFSSYSFKDGLPNDIVNTVYEDNEGNLWIGTRVGYLNQLKNSFLTVFTSREGLTNNFTRSITEGKNGVIWIGTNGNGVNKLVDGKIYVYDSKVGLPNYVVRSVTEDSKGNLWVGTYGGGLSKLVNGKFINYDSKNGFPNDIVMAITEAKDHSLWCATGAGVVIMKNKKFSKISTLDGLSHNYARCIVQDKKGDMWIGTSRGINVISNKKIHILESPDTLVNKVILTIYEDRLGYKWIGTYDEGMYRYKDGKFTRFRREQGMPDEVIYKIFEDQKGNMWMSSNLGIFGIKKEKLDNYADGKLSSLSELDYIMLNDLMGIECNGGSQPAGCLTKEGKMWFPTMIGAVLLDPAQINTQDNPPKALITGVVADNKGMDLTKKIILAPGTERIEFHYTALNYYSAENLTFKYKLEPFDKDWVYAGNRRIAYYTNLPYGNYKFKVIASNGYHLWSNEPVEFDVYVAPHFYETFWFYALAVITLFLIVFGGFQWRLKELRKRERELIRMVNDRTKELKESEERLRTLNKNKDKFFSQISHDLKSVFMSLSGFSDILVNDLKNLTIDDIFKFTKNINDSVKYLYNLMNNLLDWSRVQLGKIDYKPSPIDLKDAIAKVIHVLQSNAELKGISIKNSVPNNCIVYADEIMFYSIMNNLITNSIKFSKRGGQIDIYSSRQDDYYNISVKDRGIGIENNLLEKVFKIEEVQSLPGTENEKGTGLGLILCKDFVMKNKGEIRIKSEVGTGTTVTFTLPGLRV
jgi:ligand-binding sensor domain-containing protein/signal transduction histidine kinase